MNAAEKSNICTWRGRVFLAAGLGGALLAATQPARAFDDRPSSFAPLWNMMGSGADDDDKPKIDFRERPKIVVPKNMGDLPAPREPLDKRASNWPQDQDALARAQAKKAARAPQQIEYNKNLLLSKNELNAGRTDEPGSQVEICTPKSGGAYDCSAPEPASKIKQLFSFGGEDKDSIIQGKEPERVFLTEPPKGYRAATRTVRATAERPREKVEAADPRAYLRQQAKRDLPPED